ncbi:SGNH/GDSL hydrolase family protein [Nicoliella lavandulae]|uniref:SGNH/GDSL hydrolase family protein n=1 Tax=Nicoliella lavandulae TaxID=3082954 RepID=A0ABU8SM27_9LACO
MKNRLFKTAIATILGGLSYRVAKSSIKIMKGNDELYAPSSDFYNPTSKLNDKRIVFLGSSITYGLAAKGNSFVDFLKVEHGVDAVKEAVSGTTLAGNDKSSYVERLKDNIDLNQQLDAFVCQLSTNDQRKGKPMGKISNSFDINAFDTETTIGAIEYIIAYVNEHWSCPIIFFTCLRKPEPEYEALRQQLFKLQQKWNFEIIDIWGNEHIKKLNEKHPEYMADDSHPTRAGYRYCWTPVFVRELDQIVE